MHAKVSSVGEVEIDGRRFAHDVVVEGGHVRKRRKGPSKAYRARYGHTPLSAEEAIPWTSDRLIVGTGVSGQLPVMDDVYAEAGRRGVEVIALPTRDACELIAREDESRFAAILHVTC